MKERKEDVELKSQLQDSICSTVRNISDERQLKLIKIFVEAKKGTF